MMYICLQQPPRAHLELRRLRGRVVTQVLHENFTERIADIARQFAHHAVRVLHVLHLPLDVTFFA